MEFFGLNMYGVGDPIKDMMRADYVEPKSAEKTLKASEGEKIDYVAELRELDCYLRHVDGYAYGSNSRLRYMRRKYVLKPDGPTKMYRYTGTDSMNYGWWSQSPEIVNSLSQNDWHKNKEKYPVYWSDTTRYFEHCRKIDKYFRM